MNLSFAKVKCFQAFNQSGRLAGLGSQKGSDWVFFQAGGSAEKREAGRKQVTIIDF
jgi:hypothetical protein